MGEWRSHRKTGIEASLHGLHHVEVRHIPRPPNKNRLLPIQPRPSPLANPQNFHMEVLPLHARPLKQLTHPLIPEFLADAPPMIITLFIDNIDHITHPCQIRSPWGRTASICRKQALRGPVSSLPQRTPTATSQKVYLFDLISLVGHLLSKVIVHFLLGVDFLDFV